MMNNDCLNKNCLYILEIAILYNLTETEEKCKKAFFVSFENTLFGSHLLEHNHIIDEVIFVEFLTVNMFLDSALYQMLEFFVRSGKLKSYKKAISKIRFLTMSVDEIILASLLTKTEKYALISNIEANRKGSEPILSMPEHLSSNREMRQEKPAISICYKYFWIIVLVRSPIEHYAIIFKRMLATELFSRKHIEDIKEKLESHSRSLQWSGLGIHGNNAIIWTTDNTNNRVELSFNLE